MLQQYTKINNDALVVRLYSLFYQEYMGF